MSGVYTGSYGVSVTLNSSHPDVTLTAVGRVDAYGPLGTFAIDVNGTLTAEPLLGALGGPVGTVFTVNNFGLIETHGTSASNQFDLGVLLAAGSLINAGEIFGASGVGVPGSGGPAVVSNGGLIEGSIGVGVFLATGGTLRNTGSIAGEQTGADLGGSVTAYLSNASTGIISAAVNYGVQFGGPGLVVNAGVILGNDGGLQLGPGGTLENSGRIGETGVPTGTYGNYAGLDLYQNGTIFNSLGGEIYGANGIAGQGSAGSYIFNAGSIKGTQKDGVQLFDGPVSLVNSGTILSAATVSNAQGGYAGVYLAGGATVVNEAGGLIKGPSGIRIMGPGTNEVANAGVIRGGGTGASGIYFLIGGTVSNTGSIIGGRHGVVVEGSGGYGFGSISNSGLIEATTETVSTDGTIHKGSAIALLEGGNVSNAAHGTIAGAVGVYLRAAPTGDAGAIGLENAGTIIGTYHIGVNLETPGYVQNSGSIYGGHDAVYLVAGGQLNNEAGGTLNGAHNGVYVLSGTAMLANDGVIAGLGTAGDAGVLLQNGGTVTNALAGTISGAGGIAVNETTGAALSVSNAGLISGVYYGISDRGGQGFVSNSGTIEGTTKVFAVGTVTLGGAGIALGAGGTIINQLNGTIIGYNGIYAGQALSLSNAGLVEGQNYFSGVYLQAGGNLQNTGTIIADNAAAVYDGSALSATYLDNSGSIASTGSVHNAGVYLLGGGVVNNLIGGRITSADIGVGIGGAGGTLVNAGYIAGAKYFAAGLASAGDRIINSGKIAGAQGDGVLLSNGGTLTNASFGLISAGGYAVHDNGVAGYILNQGTLAGRDGVLVFNTASGATTVVNTGTISAVYEGISLAESFAAAGLGLVVNDGQVSENAASEVSGSNTFTPDAVQIETFGTLLNEAGGTISAAGFGVADFAASGPASVSNAGVIYGALGGIQSGFYDALSITNSGSIGGGAGNGVSLGDAGRLVNEAGGRISGGQSAVQGNGASAYVLNLGQIGGTNGISVFTTATGATTLINEGTIAVSYGALDLYETFGVAGAGLVENDGLVSSSAATETGIGGVTFNATAVNIETGAMFVNEARATVSAAGFAFGDFNTPGAALMVNDGLIEGALGAVSVGADEQLTLVNAGTIESSAGGGVYFGGGGTLVDSGLIEAASGYAALGAGSGALELVLDAGAKLVGGVFTDASFSNVLQLAGNMAGSFDLGGSVNGFGTIMFAPGVDWALGGNQQELAGGEIIQGFTAGDTIVLDGVNDLAGKDSYTVASAGTLSVDADGTFYNLLIAGATVGQSDFVLSSGLAITEVTCYVAGTRILTETGEMPVEEIKIGDRLPTLYGGLRAVKWIGRRSYDGRFIARNKRALPVCIKAGALRDGVPKRDLWVSPGHAIYVDGALVHAGRLVNGVSIIQPMQVDRVDYYHIEMETHEVIFAEGCAAETFLDEHFRGLFQNAAEFGARYPGQSAPARLCLARLDAGRGLAARRRRIAARAAGRGEKKVALS